MFERNNFQQSLFLDPKRNHNPVTKSQAMTASRRRDHYVTEYGFPFILVLVNDSNSTSILCIFMMSPLLSFVRFYVSVHRCVGMEFGAIFITMEQNTIPRNLMLTFQNEMQQGHQIWSTFIVKPSLLCLFGNSTFYLNLKSIFHVIADFLSVQFLSMQMIVFVYDEKQREEEFNRKWNWSICWFGPRQRFSQFS